MAPKYVRMLLLPSLLKVFHFYPFVNMLTSKLREKKAVQGKYLNTSTGSRFNVWLTFESPVFNTLLTKVSFTQILLCSFQRNVTGVTSATFDLNKRKLRNKKSVSCSMYSVRQIVVNHNYKPGPLDAKVPTLSNYADPLL